MLLGMPGHPSLVIFCPRSFWTSWHLDIFYSPASRLRPPITRNYLYITHRYPSALRFPVSLRSLSSCFVTPVLKKNNKPPTATTDYHFLFYFPNFISFIISSDNYCNTLLLSLRSSVTEIEQRIIRLILNVIHGVRD